MIAGKSYLDVDRLKSSVGVKNCVAFSACSESVTVFDLDLAGKRACTAELSIFVKHRIDVALVFLFNSRCFAVVSPFGVSFGRIFTVAGYTKVDPASDCSNLLVCKVTVSVAQLLDDCRLGRTAGVGLQNLTL